MEVLSVHSRQGVEQAVPGGVISPVAHVQAANERYEAPFVCLLAHVGIRAWSHPMRRAVLTWATPPKLF